MYYTCKIVLYTKFKSAFSQCKVVPKTEIEVTILNCRERGSHARGLVPAQNTSRMGTATKIIFKSSNISRGTVLRQFQGKSHKQGLTNAKNLTITLSEWRDSPWHRSNQIKVPNLSLISADQIKVTNLTWSLIK